MCVGFLNTGDLNVTGNMGLKVANIKIIYWIKNKK
jgi:hypothetical protein